MLVATLLLLSAQAQTVSFSHPVATCRAIIPKLGEALGTPMRAEGDVQWEVLFVKASNASPAEIKANIAKAAQGKWEIASDGVQVLRRDSSIATRHAEKAKKDLITSMQDYVKFTQTGIRTYRNSTGAPPNTTGVEESPEKEDVMATDKVIGQLVNSIGVNVLSSLGKGQRVVYSTNPNQMQRAIRFDPNWVSVLAKEHNQQFSEVQEDPNVDQMGEMLEAYPPEVRAMLREMYELEKPKRMGTNAAKVNLVFERSKLYENFEASIHIYDEKGSELGNFERTLGDQSFDDTFEDFEEYDEEGRPKPTQDASPSITLSSGSKKLMSFMNGEARGPTMGESNIAYFNELKGKMSDPEVGDPWLTVYDEVLSGWGKHETANMAINVADDNFRYQTVFTVNRLRKILRINEPVENWITYTPSTPSKPLDRSLLKAAIQRMEKGDIRLDDRAWFATTFPSSFYNSTYAFYQMVFKFPYTYYDQTIELYALLNDSQKMAAKNGIKIPFASMSKGLKDLVYNMAFGADHVMEVGHMPMEDMFGQTGDMETYFKREFEKRKNRQDFLQEPTEALPRGLPSDGYLEISVKEGNGYLPVEKDNDLIYGMGSQSMSLEQLAGMLAMTDMMKSEYPMPVPTEFKEVSRSEWKLELKATSVYGFSGTLQDNVSKPGTKPKKVEDFGADFAKLLAESKEKMKKWLPLGMGMGSRGRGQAPPP